MFIHAAKNVLDSVSFDFLTTHGTERVADTGIQKSKVLVYLRTRTYCTPWVAACDLLLNGNGGWNTLNVVALRLLQSAEKLSGVAAQTLHIPTLTLGIKCVKGKTALSASAQSCDDYQLVSRYFQVNILEIVDAGSLYDDMVFQ